MTECTARDSRSSDARRGAAGLPSVTTQPRELRSKCSARNVRPSHPHEAASRHRVRRREFLLPGMRSLRRESTGLFRPDGSHFLRFHLTRIALPVAHALMEGIRLTGMTWRGRETCSEIASPYCATSSSMGVSLVTFEPWLGVCSMTVPFGPCGEDA